MNTNCAKTPKTALMLFLSLFNSIWVKSQCKKCECKDDTTWRRVENFEPIRYQQLDDSRKIKISVIFHFIKKHPDNETIKRQVQEQLQYLNRDYQLRNTDTSSVDPVYKSFIGNPNIEFSLADTIIDQNLARGVVTKRRGLHVYMENASAPVSPRSILNIYVGNIKQSDGYVNGCSWCFDDRSSHVVHVESLDDDDRLLTHEVGHWLSLWHIFDGNCKDSEGDEISDTPPQQQSSFETVLSYTDALKVKCTGISDRPMVNNYMDYSNCRYMFTKMQVKTMRLFVKHKLPEIWNKSGK